MAYEPQPSIFVDFTMLAPIFRLKWVDADKSIVYSFAAGSYDIAQHWVSSLKAITVGQGKLIYARALFTLYLFIEFKTNS